MKLTPRQKQVLWLLVTCKTNRQIALDLGISEQTVKNHLRNMYDRMDVCSRLEAVMKAIRLGIVKIA